MHCSTTMSTADCLLTLSPATFARPVISIARSSFFMDVKCPGCFNITTVFSHAQVCDGTRMKLLQYIYIVIISTGMAMISLRGMIHQ